MQVSLRALAVNNIKAAAAYYHSHAGPKTTLEFVEAFEDAINHLRRFPLTGSFRFASELEVPDLQSWTLRKFPYIIFYVARAERIDIWRVLQGVARNCFGAGQGLCLFGARNNFGRVS